MGMGLHVNYLMIDYTTNSRYEERVTWKSNTNFTAINKKSKEICRFEVLPVLNYLIS